MVDPGTSTARLRLFPIPPGIGTHSSESVLPPTKCTSATERGGKAVEFGTIRDREKGCDWIGGHPLILA